MEGRRSLLGDLQNKDILSPSHKLQEGLCLSLALTSLVSILKLILDGQMHGIPGLTQGPSPGGFQPHQITWLGIGMETKHSAHEIRGPCMQVGKNKSYIQLTDKNLVLLKDHVTR